MQAAYIPGRITVTIPFTGEPFDYRIYTDNEDCYLVGALKRAGFEDVYVGPLGHTRIGSESYYPSTKTPFSSEVLHKSFEDGKSLTVTLIRQ